MDQGDYFKGIYKIPAAVFLDAQRERFGQDFDIDEALEVFNTDAAYMGLIDDKESFVSQNGDFVHIKLLDCDQLESSVRQLADLLKIDSAQIISKVDDLLDGLDDIFSDDMSPGL